MDMAIQRSIFSLLLWYFEFTCKLLLQFTTLFRTCLVLGDAVVKKLSSRARD